MAVVTLVSWVRSKTSRVTEWPALNKIGNSDIRNILPIWLEEAYIIICITDLHGTLAGRSLSKMFETQAEMSEIQSNLSVVISKGALSNKCNASAFATNIWALIVVWIAQSEQVTHPKQQQTYSVQQTVKLNNFFPLRPQQPTKSSFLAPKAATTTILLIYHSIAHRLSGWWRPYLLLKLLLFVHLMLKETADP